MPELTQQQASLLNQWYQESRGKAANPDHVSSTVSLAGGESKPEWYRAIQNYVMHLEATGRSAYNQDVYRIQGGGYADTPGATKKKILSGTGFPAGTSVVYSPSSPLSYLPWVGISDRPINQLVIHSFGHQWHATKVGSKWKGRMNETGGVTAVTANVEGTNQVVYIASGTDTSNGMANSDRFGAAFKNMMFTQYETLGAHFVIDRVGNLFVTADCNDVLKSSLELSDTCLSVMLEEALYSETLPSPSNPATWLPDRGSDGYPGTAGTLKYFDFSPSQLITLSALIKKLQMAYPNLVTTDYSTAPGSIGPSQFGYVLHSHIKGSQHTDPSPHFYESGQWDILFELVNTHTVSPDGIFVAPISGPSARTWWVAGLSPATDANDNSVSQLVSIDPIYTTLSLIRAVNIVNKGRSDYNLSAGDQASEMSRYLRKKLASLDQALAVMNTPVEIPDNVG